MKQSPLFEPRVSRNVWMPPAIQPKGDNRWQAGRGRLAQLANQIEPISLKEMDGVALLNRTDTKFVMSTSLLEAALAELRLDYCILSVGGQRLNHYRTLYFDTADFDLYHLHVNGAAERYKVRSREYTDSQKSFLEVKHKTRKDRTVKERMRTSQPVVQLDYAVENWLNGVFPYDSRALEPKLWNTFTRLTLVSKLYFERVTLDIDLAFYAGAQSAQLGGVAIAEVKMDARSGDSPFMQQMRHWRVAPQGISKYCLGVSMLYSEVKKNSMKPKIRRIEKISEGVVFSERAW